MKHVTPKALAIALLGVAAAVVLIVMMIRTGPVGDEAPAPNSAPVAAADATTPADSPPGTGAARTFVPGGEAKPAVAPEKPAELPQVSVPEPGQWDERISELLTNQDITNRDAARELIAMAADKRGTDDQRIDAVEHALNLVDDETYTEDALALAVDPSLPEEMQEILFADLHNRDPEISVPVADRISKVKGHPLAEEAKDFVDFFRDEPLDTPEPGSAPPAPAAAPAAGN
ncbi:MAG: hypothetical protein H7A53_07690 [Akkermansiaceae bacterium]|nr:hypothetical protein [Akkermansiaceae bacterium]MCP5550756.1 hypothetical protein [Akkermansiaceae bacterium]